MADVGDPAVAVTLIVAATNDHISFARLTTTALAGKIGFDYDAIEDVRIAVSELCGAVIGQAQVGSELSLSIRGGANGLTVTGSAPVASDGVEFEPDELSEQVLGAVVDSHSYDTVNGQLRFTMTRRNRPSES